VLEAQKAILDKTPLKLDSYKPDLQDKYGANPYNDTAKLNSLVI